MVRPESSQTSGASTALAGRLGSPWRRASRKPMLGFVKMPRRFEPCTMCRKQVNDHAQDHTGVAERRLRHTTLAGVAGTLSQAAPTHDGGADDVPRDRHQIF